MTRRYTLEMAVDLRVPSHLRLSPDNQRVAFKRLNSEHGWQLFVLDLSTMVETPLAMLHAEEIASAHERLTVLVMGTNDLAKELYAEHVPGRQPLLAGLGLCLLAARASGTAILDGVYNDVKDNDGAASSASTARR